MSSRISVRINRNRSFDLIAGRDVTIKIPNGAKELTILLDVPKSLAWQLKYEIESEVEDMLRSMRRR